MLNGMKNSIFGELSNSFEKQKIFMPSLNFTFKENGNYDRIEDEWTLLPLNELSRYFKVLIQEMSFGY